MKGRKGVLLSEIGRQRFFPKADRWERMGEERMGEERRGEERRGEEKTDKNRREEKRKKPPPAAP